ncbi:MAG: hypothetical protein ACPGWR_18725 [Ardenticatenaceae bacterium]
MSYGERLEEAASKWVANGKDKAMLLKDGDFVRARLWSCSRGGKNEGYSKEVEEWLAASLEEFGEARWRRSFFGRDYCSFCGTRFLKENLYLCTGCSKYVCYKCYWKYGTHPNGNQKCRCAGEMIG